MKPIRYTQEMIDEYTSKGLWTSETWANLWERNAKLYPDKEALVDCKTRLTWAEAKRQIDRLALSFRELGLGKDEVIVSQLPNRIESLTIRIALEEAGILFAPAMSAWRHAEMEHAIKTTETVGIVIPWEFEGFDYFKMIEELKPSFSFLKYIFVVGDEVPQGAISIKQMCQQPLENKYPSDYLYKATFSSTETGAMCTTSGTTGLPKIVEVSSAAAICIGKGCVESIKLDSNDIVLSLVPIHSGPGGPACFAAPIAGAKIILMEKFDPEEALRLTEKERVTVVVSVPIQIIMMARDPNFDKYDLSSLRLIVWSGSPLPYYMAVELEQRLGCTLVGGYGAWDAGSFTFSSIDDPPEIRHLTAGKPIKGNEIKLVNDKEEEMPPGEVGNILVRGASCFPGYYKDPEAVLKAWTAMGKEGWFKTGDLGKFDEHGNLSIMGRREDIIRRSGKEILPLEIESLLVTHPNVANVAVVPMPDPVTGEKACAYVIPLLGQKFAFAEMISYLKEKGLPADKLPERLEVVKELPTSEGGLKVLRKELIKDITQKLKAGDI